MKLGPFFFLASLLLMHASCSTDDTEPISSEEEFETYLKDEMDAEHIPALSALVFKGDQVLYEGYFGKSNIKNDVNLKADHVFMLASVSKTITATALLQLYDDGLFALDDNINDHLPFDVKIPGESKEITFKMLLTHTSGIADGDALDDQYYYGKDSPVDLGEFLEKYLVEGGEYYDEKQNFHAFEPGTEYQYTNVGNALIAVLVEEISEKGFNEYCKENIFKPLGMNNTYWRLDEISGTIVQPYHYKSRDYEAIDHYTFTDYPNGGLRSNAIDMFKFLQAFALEGKSNGYQLLKAETAKAVIKPQIADIDASVGLHMFLMNEDHNLWGHDGGEQGVATIMAFNPDTKIGALLFSNQGDADLDGMLEEAYLFGKTF